MSLFALYPISILNKIDIKNLFSWHKAQKAEIESFMCSFIFDIYVYILGVVYIYM